ncbi:ABC transporter permease [Fibrobacterales bacterium]|nr:ABC transporter permease [Fibrobacterales bacterium]
MNVQDKSLFQLYLGEWKSIFKDRSVFLIFILGPILYSFFYPLPYSEQIVRDIPIVIVDNDHSSMSRKLATMTNETDEVAVKKVVYSQAEAEALLKKGEVYGVLAIPKNFEARIRQGKSVQVELMGDAGYFLIYSQSVTGMYKAAATLGAGIEIRRMQAKGQTYTKAKQLRDPLPLQKQSLFNSVGGYMSYVVPAVLVLILQQTLLIGMGLRNTRKKLLLKEIFARSLTYVTIYLSHILFYTSVVFPYLGLYKNFSLDVLLVWSLLFLFLTIGWGWLLSLLFKNRLALMQLMIIVSMPLLFLTGFSWPLESFPKVLYYLSQILPATLSLPTFLRVHQMHVNLELIAPAFLMMLGQAVVVWILFFLLRKIKRT